MKVDTEVHAGLEARCSRQSQLDMTTANACVTRITKNIPLI